MLRYLTNILLFMWATCLPAVAATGLVPLQVPGSLIPGDAARVSLLVPGEVELIQGHLDGTSFPLTVSVDDNVPPGSSPQRIVEGIIATSMFTEPGPVALRIGGVTEAGDALFYQTTVTVLPKDFGLEHLTIKKLTTFTAAERARMKKEGEAIHQAVTAEPTPKKWQDSFILPVDSKVTSPFGRRRTQNGKPRSPHGGLDLRAKTGTPIKAAGNGVVVLSHDFLLPGSVVYLDHGLGLVTAYFHLSERSVAVGDEVKQNQQVGLAGATGRVNAPHLHWQVYWQGIKINPLSLGTLY